MAATTMSQMKSYMKSLWNGDTLNGEHLKNTQVKRDAVNTSGRLAGSVTRYHTWPTITNQTIAEHTWHMMRIWDTLFGAMSPEVSLYILYHDVGELVAGDPPYPIKQNNPDLKVAYDRVEAYATFDIIGMSLPVLDAPDQVRVKVCDLLEMFEYGVHEYCLGNRFAWPVIHDTLEQALKMIEKDVRLGLASTKNDVHAKVHRFAYETLLDRGLVSELTSLAFLAPKS